MIKGIGVDIVEVGRIGGMIEKYGQQFLQKVFTEAEAVFCEGKADRAVHFAGRWAAKEAFYKALPAECQALSSWKSIEVISDSRGAPVVGILSPELEQKMGEYGITSCLVTISHEKKNCVANVLLQ